MKSGATHGSTVHFGGPDRERGALRDLLERHIEAVPRGGAIHWATYYFREVFVADRDPAVFAQLDERWHHIYRECLAQREAG